ncbi:hypothetical protein Cgig2_013854 [Carnegiea gigantea]|uniref:Uncharacterized protein n=1 Tax=Carnegiea gigantea TaxID=171969 RepID=A0A9Q1KJ81_9CARY|nr:hypothetical protein Cgig2_013854 [Carnegiea gigantea]
MEIESLRPEVDWPLGFCGYLCEPQHPLCLLYKYRLILFETLLKHLFLQEGIIQEDRREKGDRESLRRATCSPRPLPDDYQDLCPHFSLPEAERVALDFELPEMVQAIFYAMLLNDAIVLGIVRGFIVDDLKSTLMGLRWTCFEACLSRTSRDLCEAQLRQQTLTGEAHESMDS